MSHRDNRIVSEMFSWTYRYLTSECLILHSHIHRMNFFSLLLAYKTWYSFLCGKKGLRRRNDQPWQEIVIIFWASYWRPHSKTHEDKFFNIKIEFVEPFVGLACVPQNTHTVQCDFDGYNRGYEIIRVTE